MGPMRRWLIVLLVLALPSPAAAQTRVPRNASVLLADCRTSLQQSQRAATFVGRMRMRGPAQKLQMRFTLQTRAGSESRWQRVAAPGWDVWVTSDPGVRAYTYEKRVENLAAPAQYRAVVRFRWRNALGRVVRTVRMGSPVCRQTDLRPDLRPLRLLVDARPDSTAARYMVPVVNLGRTASGPFILVVTVDGIDEPGQAVPSLAPGERRVVELAGRRCTPGAGGLYVRVDGAGQVDERNEADNSLARPCQ